MKGGPQRTRGTLGIPRSHVSFLLNSSYASYLFRRDTRGTYSHALSCQCPYAIVTFP